VRNQRARQALDTAAQGEAVLEKINADTLRAVVASAAAAPSSVAAVAAPAATAPSPAEVVVHAAAVSAAVPAVVVAAAAGCGGGGGGVVLLHLCLSWSRSTRPCPLLPSLSKVGALFLLGAQTPAKSSRLRNRNGSGDTGSAKATRRRGNRGHANGAHATTARKKQGSARAAPQGGLASTPRTATTQLDGPVYCLINYKSPWIRFSIS